VEKDGSLTDIKVLRDIGYGTGKEERVLTKVRDGIQVFKMGSRLEYILFRSKFKQRINVGKGINIRRNRSKSDFFSLWQFCFRCLSSFGIIDYLYERLSLDMNMGYRIAFGILLIVYSL
jgi:hypothetical protein